MKVYKRYLKDFLYFINNKKYMLFVLLTLFLSYGFMLSNFSIGIDDLCLDRYVSDSYILSAGRWGTWLVYNILNIDTYIPFWVDFVSIILLFITSVIVCIFVKNITKNKLKDISYILFSMGYISFPVISCFMVYLPTKLSIVLSNLIVTIIFIILYEMFINQLKIKKLYYIFIILGLIFSISMYESCCQTFVVLSFMSLFLYDKYNKKLQTKDIIKFLLKVFGILLLSIIVNYLINQIIFLILDNYGILEKDYSFRRNIMDLYREGNGLIEIILFKLGSFVVDLHYYNIIFLSLVLITSLYVFVDNCGNFKSFFLYLGIMFSNYILLFILSINLFRICYSWILTFSFILLYFSNRIKKKYVLVIAFTLILFNTKSMTLSFYNDFRTYQRDLLYSNQIITQLYSNVEDLNKPILFVYDEIDDLMYDFDNGIGTRNSVYKWGLNAFNEKGTEIIKFINHIGYNFDIVDNYDEAYLEYTINEGNLKKEKVFELENFIVVKIDNYY